jgi:sirohydrochlorin cobaltochelatase
MDSRILIVVDTDVPGAVASARRSARQLSYELKGQVVVAEVTGSQLETIRQAALSPMGVIALHEVQTAAGSIAAPPPAPPPVSAAPMAPAPFIWLEDGRPDWAQMWQGFCELALFGGPPHRGEAQALHPSPTPDAPGHRDYDAVAEIIRGIYETTGLRAAAAEDGWLAVQCDSPKMAAWLCATIVLENVDARFEGDRLLVPAAPDFDLKDEVKSVITVLAKTHHYWQVHVQRTAPDV